MEPHIALDVSVRQQVAQHLSLLLSDTFVLCTKTQNYRWNLLDARFYALHVLLEKLYRELAESVDEIAERIRMLGVLSPGSLKQFLEMTSLKEAGDDLSGDEMLQDLLNDHETMISFIRGDPLCFSNLGDEGTADLLIQRLRSHEKSAWDVTQ